MSSSAARVFIQVESEAEQQEHIKNQRKTLKSIQSQANDKENLTGRQQTSCDQLGRLKAATATASINCSVLATQAFYGKRKRVGTRTVENPTVDAVTQTDVKNQPEDAANKPITAEDLTNVDEPGENYYKRLAERRRLALEKTLDENQHLIERIEGLENELNITRKQLEEAHLLVETLKEIMEEMPLAEKRSIDDDNDDDGAKNVANSDEESSGP